jgi:Phage terminase-like protein, large subunit
MLTRKCNRHPYIDDYLEKIETDEIRSSKEMKLVVKLIDEKLDNEDIYIDNEKIAKAVELIEKYFEIKLLDWELCILALIHCYHDSSDMVVFDEFLIVMGRGNGKNGFVSPLVWYLTTHYHGVDGYNVDIIANNEEQAKTSFGDIYDVLEKNWDKLKHFFYKSKAQIDNLKTRSYIKYNTSNAKTKDGKRSACLVFDEIHEYENYDTIEVFTSGFGKRKHSRTFYITTNGYVRDGVLDDMLEMASRVLAGEVPNSGMLPMIYKIDDESEAENPDCWVKANPSLPYLPELQKEMAKDAEKMKYQPHKKRVFLTKRMNLPKNDAESMVVDFEYIQKTNKPIPDLTGKPCVVGIDFMKVNDFASVNARFKDNETRYDINHSWLCTNSADIPRLRVPWEMWVEQKLLTKVDAVQIGAEVIAGHIKGLMQKYDVKAIAMDGYRYQLLKNELEELGFTPERKNLYLVRPSDIMKIVPVLESQFLQEQLIWGDNPVLRWATNNTKKIASGKKQGTDTGNFYFGKIEGKSRKTDPFMALTASAIIEDRLIGAIEPPKFKVYKF